MIINLPVSEGHSKKLTPALICVFQTAEIQRLQKYVDEYRIHQFQRENQELDRHSYEVQIQELTFRLKGEDALLSEINKLHHHIQRLRNENEELKKSFNTNINDQFLKNEQTKTRSFADFNVSNETDKKYVKIDQFSNKDKLLSEQMSQKNDIEKNHEKKYIYLKNDFQTFKNENFEILGIEEKIILLFQSIERLKIINKEYSNRADQILIEKIITEGQLRVCQNQKNRLEEEISTLQNKLQQAHEIISNHLKEKTSTKNKQFFQYTSQVDQSNKKNGELKQQIANLRKKLSNQFANIIEKQKLLESFRSSNEGFISKIRMMQRKCQEKVEKYEEKLLGIEICINKIISQNSSIRKEKIQMNREIGRNKTEYQNLIHLLQNKVQKLQEKVKQLLTKSSADEEQVIRLQRLLSKRYLDLKLNKNEYCKKNAKILFQQNLMVEDFEKTDKIVFLQEQCQKLLFQNDRLQQQLANFDPAVKEMSLQFDRLHSQISILKKDRLMSMEKNRELVQKVEKLVQSNKMLEKKLGEKEAIINTLSSPIT